MIQTRGDWEGNQIGGRRPGSLLLCFRRNQCLRDRRSPRQRERGCPCPDGQCHGVSASPLAAGRYRCPAARGRRWGERTRWRIRPAWGNCSPRRATISGPTPAWTRRAPHRSVW